jgi:hypothetical protein
MERWISKIQALFYLLNLIAHLLQNVLTVRFGFQHSITPFRGWQGGRDSNPQPTVLETATLPIELPPYAITSVTRPAPMVRPPSRIAKR